MTPAGSRAAIVLGLLGVLVLPVAVFLTRFWDAYTLVHSGLAVPLAALLGVATLLRLRSTRPRISLHATPDRGRRVARWLGVGALALAASGTLALAVYGVLTWLGTRE